MDGSPDRLSFGIMGVATRVRQPQTHWEEDNQSMWRRGLRVHKTWRRSIHQTARRELPHCIKQYGRQKSAKICFQYVLVLSELEPVHWAGQLIIENMLSRNYPIINLYVDTKAHSVFANYWADIHSADDFKTHFSFICDKVHEIQNDISELMPKICRDFSDYNSKEKTPIGFR